MPYDFYKENKLINPEIKDVFCMFNDKKPLATPFSHIQPEYYIALVVCDLQNIWFIFEFRLHLHSIS